MKAVLIQDTGAEIETEVAACISCAPLGAFTIVTSNTHMILQVHDRRWQVAIAEIVMFMQTYGKEIKCDYPSI